MKNIQLIHDNADIHPAAKFTQPDQLLSGFFNHFSITQHEKSFDLTLPDFFGNDSTELKLTFFYKNDMYFVHDNGSAFSVLKNNAGEKYDTILKTLNLDNLQQTFVYRKFIGFNNFFYYLQNLIYIANADLIYENIDDKYFLFAHDKEDLSDAENIDADKFINTIKQNFKTTYDEDKGLIFVFPRLYPDSTISASYRIETLCKNKIRIRDNLQGCFEGDILACLLCADKNLSTHADFISLFTERFGCEFDGKAVSITAEIEDGNFVPALLKFVNLAVLLSDVGFHIQLSR